MAGQSSESPSSMMDFQAEGSQVQASIEGGFEPDMFLDRIQDSQRCSYCRKVLRGPRQRRCGHLFCESCLHRLYRNIQMSDMGEDVFCPSCVLEETIDDESTIKLNEEVTRDYAVSRALSFKKVRCPQSRCNFQGQLREYESRHELSCQFATMDCPNLCGESVHISLLRTHMENQCPERKVACAHCGQQFSIKDEEVHLSACPNRPATCELCQKRDIIRDQMDDHLENDCLYAKCVLGCDQPILKTHMQEHYAKADIIPAHIVFVGEQIGKIQNRMKNRRSESLEGAVAAAAAPLQDHVDNSGLFKYIDELIQELQNLNGLSNVFKVEFEKLLDSAQINKQRLDQLAQNQAEMQARMQRLEQAVQIRDVQLMERDLRLRALEDVSYDGTLVWRIENFSDCRRKAQSGEMTSIYSPAFYTSRCGYKMCARLYLNGDGIGKGTHISFFFVVMRGKYDGLLRWPFQQKVTMMLLDYHSQHHIMDAFRPDSGSASFHKPKNEMNVASGCPLFMPLTALQEKITSHVRDDIAYFKIIVDCSDIPY